MNKDELKTFSRNVIEIAKKNLQEHGDLMPVLFFRDREKRMHIMGLTKFDEDIKFKLNGKVKQYAKAIDADAVVFITDSYLRFADPETGLPGPRRGEMITAIPGGQSSGTVSGMMPPQEFALSGQRAQGGTL